LHKIFVQNFGAKISQSQNVTGEKLREPLSYEKHACKMLMKLTTDQIRLKRYRVFHRFGQAKFPDGGTVLSSSQFSILPS